MRKLLFLWGAVVLAHFAYQLFANADTLAFFVVRDGLLLVVVALFVWLFHAEYWLPAMATGRCEELSVPGAVLIGVGVICTFIGAWSSQVTPPLVVNTLEMLWFLGLTCLLTALLWPGFYRPFGAPIQHWRLDVLGNDTPTASTAGTIIGATAPRRNRIWIGAWGVLLAVALLARLWSVWQLAPDCLEIECEHALALEAGGGWTLFQGVARLIFWLSSESLFSLRLTNTLLGTLTLPLFYRFAQRYTQAGGALLATLLLALTPWHLWISHHTGPWTAVMLLLCLGAGALVQAYETRRWRAWLLAGLAWGLLLRVLPAAAPALTLWLLGALLLVILLRAWANLPRAAVAVGWALAIALPVVRDSLSSSLGAVALPSSVRLVVGLDEVLYTLLHPSRDMLLFGENPLFPPFMAALATLGVGNLLRNGKRFSVLWLLVGLVILSLTIGPALVAKTLPAESITLLALLLFALVAVALDLLWLNLQQTWQLLLSPRLATMGALLLLLVVGGRQTVTYVNQLDALRSSGETDPTVAMSRYAARQLRTLPNLTIFAPLAVIENPTTRWLLGPALTQKRLQPLYTFFDQLLSGVQPGDALYLLPSGDQQLIDLLQQLYPGANREPHFDAAHTALLFTALQVGPQNAAFQPGLAGWLTQDQGGANSVTPLPVADSLNLTWPSEQTLTGALRLVWQGSLRIPVQGEYSFGVTGGGVENGGNEGEKPRVIFGLRLDNRVVLDSSLGLLERRELLPRGFYPIEIVYQRTASDYTATLAPLIVRWQRPDGVSEIIPGNLLSHPAPPNVGLIGAYFGGTTWEVPLLDLRKDLTIGLPVDLPQPYSVRWQGKVAAPRTGEYLFVAAGPGATRLLLDGQVLVDSARTAGEPGGNSYGEGAIYLTHGWHAIEIYFAPNTTAKEPRLQLFWQPPGAGPAPLASNYLAPTLAELAPTDRAIPLMAPLADARLGDDQFALSQSVDFWRPQVRIPPTGLPQLPFAPLWRAGAGCGSGDQQLNQPHGVAIQPIKQLLYVADTLNRRVVEYSLAGEINKVYTGEQFEEPYDVAIVDSAFPLVLDAAHGQIFTLNPQSGALEARPLQTSFYHPRGFGVDDQGNLAVADTGGARIAWLRQDGTEVGEFGGQGSALGRGQPVDTLAINGILWAVTAEDGRLWRLDAGGSFSAIAPTNTFHGPHLAGLPNGAFFLSDPARQTIFYHTANGQPVAQFSPPEAITPTGLATLQADNQLYLAIADSAACTVGLWRMPAGVIQ